MKLKDFVDLWIVTPHKLYLCFDKGNELLDFLVDVADGKRKIEDICPEDYCIAAIMPDMSQRRIDTYLCKELLKAEVKGFSTGETYLLVSLDYEIKRKGEK